jgi:hypothetical protein
MRQARGSRRFDVEPIQVFSHLAGEKFGFRAGDASVPATTKITARFSRQRATLSWAAS